MDSSQVLGHLVDISNSGLMIDCQKPLSTGKDYNLRLDLTDQEFGKPFLYFTARSRWMRADDMMPNMYNVGFKIVGILPHDVELLSLIVEKYASKDGNTFPWK
jgi:hypothetical protein